MKVTGKCCVKIEIINDLKIHFNLGTLYLTIVIFAGK